MPIDKKAVKEGAQVVALAAGGVAARLLWATLRTVLVIIAVSSLVYQFVLKPKLAPFDPYRAAKADREHPPWTKPPGSEGAPTALKYRYHYVITDEQKQKLLDAWPRDRLQKIYVVSPQDTLAGVAGVPEEMRKAQSEEGRAAAKDLAQFLWDNSINAGMVDETEAKRFRPQGIQLVVNSGDRYSRPPDVDLLLALFNAAKIPASCCQADPAVPEGGVAVSIGNPY